MITEIMFPPTNQLAEQPATRVLRADGRCLESGADFYCLSQAKELEVISDDPADERPGTIARELIKLFKRIKRNSGRPGKPAIRASQILDRVRGSPEFRLKRSPSSGFSLVETMLAMALVFFLLAGTAQMLCYSFLLKQRADLHRISADLVSNKIEVLRSLGPEDEALSPGVHQETVQDKNSGRSFFLTWEVSEEDNLKKIQLSLYPAPFGSRPPLRACWFRSETLGF